MSKYLKSLAAIAFSVFLIFNQYGATVSAIEAKQRKLYNKGINYYDLQACEASNGDIELVGDDNLKNIFAFMRSKDLSAVQAAAVVGNVSRESGGDPQIIQGGGRSKDPADAGSGGWGIIQWTPGAKIIGIAKDMKIDGPIYELETQLEILYGHMKGTSPTGAQNMLAGFKKIDNITEATIYFEDKVEGAGIPAYEDRIARAKLALKKYGGVDGSSVNLTGEIGDCDCSGSGCDDPGTGDLSSTIKSYAHPQYHAAPFIEAKDAYKSATKRVSADGQYIGGIAYPGIDCGGFVTRAMIDSGFERRYNYGGKLSNGAGATPAQEAWMQKNWQKINPKDTGDLKPGDVAINSGHTYMYVGKIDGFGSVIASASLDSRAPMAGHETPADPSFNWYRKK